MSLHIIIDGYNLIRQSGRLGALDRQDMQQGREALADMLVAYKKVKGHRITIVFDGTGAPVYSQQRDRRKGISIVFSRNGETADAVIKKMARLERQRALVVSSDNEIVRSAESSGAATISADKFEARLEMSIDSGNPETDQNDNRGWKPTTKKKGPSRRLPKRKRTNRAKIRKL
jgi:predicted RNA-binding protein with PIN domain